MSTPGSSSKQPRYSFLRLRPLDPFRRDSESPGLFYPPLTPEYLMSSSTSQQQQRPHPYQLAAITSPSEPDTEAGGMQAAQEDVMRSRDRDKEPSSSDNAHIHPQRFSSGPRLRARTPSIRSPLLEKYKLLILLILFLPIPPLLSLIYTLTGHAILRNAHPTAPAWSATLLSSAGASATGGIILSLPLALVLYLLVYPAPREVAPADFFEDDESLFTRHPAIKYGAYFCCFILALFIGAIAAPLGVTCVSGRNNPTLTSRNAAVAGLVGGVIICGGLCVLVGFGVGVWLVAATRRKSGEQERDVSG